MSALAAILLILAVLAAIVIGFIAVFGGMLGPSFNRFNPFLTRSAASPDPACGSCGYATHGISTLACPECGADLREVGIITPRMRRGGGGGCLLPVGFSLLVFICAAVLAPILMQYVPQHDLSKLSTDLQPNSLAYVQADLEVTVLKTFPPSSQSHARSFTTSGGTYYSYNGPNRTSQRTISWGMLQPPAQVRAIRIEITPLAPATAWRSGTIDIEPQTLAFDWSDPQGSTHSGNAPLTQFDVLAFLKACGADTSQTAVQRESQELFALIDGLSKGMDKFTLHEFDGTGISSNSISSGPAWGWVLSYPLTWIAIWILGLLWIARRAKRKAAH